MRASWCLVCCLQMREPALVRLDEVCREHGVKLLIARSYGLVGCLRVSLRQRAQCCPCLALQQSFPFCVCLQVSLPEHRVIESKPDNSAIDLRLHAPWPELQQFADRLDLATADDVTHKHIPYGGWAEVAGPLWALFVCCNHKSLMMVCLVCCSHSPAQGCFPVAGSAWLQVATGLCPALRVQENNSVLAAQH